MTPLDELRDRLLAENPYPRPESSAEALLHDTWVQGVIATLAALPAWLREQLLSDEAVRRAARESMIMGVIWEYKPEDSDSLWRLRRVLSAFLPDECEWEAETQRRLREAHDRINGQPVVSQLPLPLDPLSESEVRSAFLDRAPWHAWIVIPLGIIYCIFAFGYLLSWAGML